MHTYQPHQPGGFWLVLAASILWGTIGVATQAIYDADSTSPLFINLARMVVATPVLLAACWHVVGRRMFHIQRRDAGVMLLNGALLAVSQAAYFASIHAAGVTIATLLTICMSPLVVTCLSVLLRLERLTARVVVALVCALAGSALLVGVRSPESQIDNLGLGALFAVLAAVTYASAILCGRFLAHRYHPLQVTAMTFGAGTLVLLVVNLIGGAVVVSTTQGWLLVLYLGLIPTALAYWLFQAGLRSVSATAASIVSMLDPLVAAGLAWALFGETLAAAGIIGAALLMLSIVLLSVDKHDTALVPTAGV